MMCNLEPLLAREEALLLQSTSYLVLFERNSKIDDDAKAIPLELYVLCSMSANVQGHFDVWLIVICYLTLREQLF